MYKNVCMHVYVCVTMDVKVKKYIRVPVNACKYYENATKTLN